MVCPDSIGFLLTDLLQNSMRRFVDAFGTASELVAEKVQDDCDPRINRMWCVHLAEFPSHTKIFATERNFPPEALVSIWFDGANIFIGFCDSRTACVSVGKSFGDWSRRAAVKRQRLSSEILACTNDETLAWEILEAPLRRSSEIQKEVSSIS
jgi:hypothetical protein